MKTIRWTDEDLAIMLRPGAIAAMMVCYERLAYDGGSEVVEDDDAPEWSYWDAAEHKWHTDNREF